MYCIWHKLLNVFYNFFWHFNKPALHSVTLKSLIHQRLSELPTKKILPKLCFMFLSKTIYINGHESKPANSNFSKKFLFDKFEGNTYLHNVLKNLVPSMSLYPSFRQLSKPAISHKDTFQRNKTG